MTKTIASTTTTTEKRNVRWTNTLLLQLYYAIKNEMNQGKTQTDGLRAASSALNIPLEKINNQFYKVQRVHGSLEKYLLSVGALENEKLVTKPKKNTQSVKNKTEANTLNQNESHNSTISETNENKKALDIAELLELEQRLQNYIDVKVAEKQELQNLNFKIRELEREVAQKNTQLLEKDGKIEQQKNVITRLRKDLDTVKSILTRGSINDLIVESEPIQARRVSIDKQGLATIEPK